MLRRLFLLFLMSLTLPIQTFAKRYITPNDNDVRFDIDNGNSSRASLSADSIKVFVWNMYKGKNPSWERDYSELIQGKDILLLQEMYMDEQMTRVFNDDQDFDYQMATAWVDTKNNVNIPSGVATASNIRPLNIFWQRSKYREPFIHTHKMVIFTEYPIQGSDKTLLTANIHAINFVGSRKMKHMIQKAAEVLANHNGPVIFGGDFNTWSKIKIHRMNKILEGIGMTKVPYSPQSIKRIFGNPLDYIWYRGLNLKAFQAHDSIVGSDHYAMEAEFSLPL